MKRWSLLVTCALSLWAATAHAGIDLDALIAGLRAPTPRDRAAAALEIHRAAVDTDVERAMVPLVPLLADQDAGVRGAASLALTHASKEAAVLELCKFLDDRAHEGSARILAIGVIEQLARKPLAADVLAAVASKVTASLCGPNPTPGVSERGRPKAAKNEESQSGTDLRVAACHALGALGALAECAVPTLASWSKDSKGNSEGAQFAALVALGEIACASKNKVAIEILAKAVADPDRFGTACTWLGQVGNAGAPAIPALLGVLKEPKLMAPNQDWKSLRVQALATIVRIAAGDSALEKREGEALSLYYEDPQCEGKLISDLNIPFEIHLPTLTRMLGSGKVHVRRSAVYCMKALFEGYKPGPTRGFVGVDRPPLQVKQYVLDLALPESQDALKALEKAQSDTDWKVKADAKCALDDARAGR